LTPSAILSFLLILLAPLAAGGVALINTGLGRSRNAAHMMLGSLCATAVGMVVFAAVGFSWQGYPGGAGYMLVAMGKGWNWIGALPLLLRGESFESSSVMLQALLGIASAALVAVIPLGSAAGRWRLGAICLSSALLAGWTYPLFAHWSWGGWLQGLGFVDAGGAGAIQAIGGLTGLSAAWILGPRRGKFTPDRMPLAIPGHDTVAVLFGCCLAWIGWIGLDGAGAILHAGAGAESVIRVAINQSLGAACSALAAAALTRIRFGKPDASLSANGWVAGLVATSAGCAAMAPAAAMFCGAIAGILVTYAVEWLELHLSVDDPGGAVAVHGLAGLWGLLAAGWFVPGAQALIQMVGIATLVGCFLPMTYGINRVLNRVWPMRTPPEGERHGLDIQELGAGAYADFITHNDDFQR
jgi:ammonium transporter, Amt family